MPANIPVQFESVWCHCAKRDIEALCEKMKTHNEDAGSLAEVFLTKGLTYNFDALYNLAQERHIPLEKFISMCCFRRQAYETLIELCVRWSSVSRVHCTNSRTMRLVTAVAADEFHDVKTLLAGHCDPSALHNLPVIVAVSRGLERIARLLLDDSRVDVAHNHSALLVYAAAQPNETLFRLILNNKKTKVSEAGAAACLAAINENHVSYAMELLQHPDWPGEDCDEVVDAILTIGCQSSEFIPLLRKAARLIQTRLDAAKEITKEVRRSHDRLKKATKFITLTMSTTLERIETDLMEAESKFHRTCGDTVEVS